MDKKIIIKDILYGEDSNPYIRIMTKGKDFDNERAWLFGEECIEDVNPYTTFHGKFRVHDISCIVLQNCQYLNGEEGDDSTRNYLVFIKYKDDGTTKAVYHLLWVGSSPDNMWLNGERVW